MISWSLHSIKIFHPIVFNKTLSNATQNLENAQKQTSQRLVATRALHGLGGLAHLGRWAGLYNFEKPSGQAG